MHTTNGDFSLTGLFHLLVPTYLRILLLSNTIEFLSTYNFKISIMKCYTSLRYGPSLILNRRGFIVTAVTQRAQYLKVSSWKSTDFFSYQKIFYPKGVFFKFSLIWTISLLSQLRSASKLFWNRPGSKWNQLLLSCLSFLALVVGHLFLLLTLLYYCNEIQCFI